MDILFAFLIDFSLTFLIFLLDFVSDFSDDFSSFSLGGGECRIIFFFIILPIKCYVIFFLNSCNCRCGIYNVTELCQFTSIELYDMMT